jgi:protein phosphatase 1A
MLKTRCSPKVRFSILRERQVRARKLQTIKCNALSEFTASDFVIALGMIGTCVSIGTRFRNIPGRIVNTDKSSEDPPERMPSRNVLGRKKIFSWGAASNKGPREYMEDTWCVKEKNGRPFADFLYAGVFDGHGGVGSSIFLRESLFGILGRFFSKVPMVQFVSSTEYSCTGHRLQEAFQYADGLLLDHISTLGDPECWSGSTATICFVNKNCLICANVGDSRAVLARNGKPIELTQDHRPLGSSKSGRSEIERINASGGWVVQGRVCGILGVSRAFGDYEFKGGREELLSDLCASSDKQALKANMEFPPVVATPDIFEISLVAEDEFIILATDGIWDTMNSAQAVTFVSSMLKRDPTITMNDIASALVERALRSRSQDNIACVIIDLR